MTNHIDIHTHSLPAISARSENKSTSNLFFRSYQDIFVIRQEQPSCLSLPLKVFKNRTEKDESKHKFIMLLRLTVSLSWYISGTYEKTTNTPLTM
jgi:hypothetical protein